MSLGRCEHVCSGGTFTPCLICSGRFEHPPREEISVPIFFTFSMRDGEENEDSLSTQFALGISFLRMRKTTELSVANSKVTADR